jgi:hypothetical protein
MISFSRAFRPISPAARQRGGMTIVMALVLLAIMSLAAFSLSRNAIRELSTTGHLIQGDKAAEASDAGLDWFIVWSHPDNMTLAYATPGAVGNQSLAKAMNDLKAPNWYDALQADGLLANSARTWDMAALVTSQETQTASNDMVFDNTNSAAVFQATNSGGSPVVQRFDLQVRFLGFQPGTLTGGGGGASGGTSQAALSTQDTLWQVVSTGFAAVPIGGGNYLRYQQRRELIGSQALSQAQAK